MTEPPLLFDRYRLIRHIGRGAYATVYLADDLRMGRQVAIKVVEDAADTEGRAFREARAAAKLDHPHIVSVHEVKREQDRTYLFTEYVEGQTLRQAFAGRQLTDLGMVVAAIQICRGLQHAHRRGVIHRDIKPENIMLVAGEDTDVRIMDFGVAQLEDLSSITRDGDLVGTLAYMAPEQVQGGTVDSRADVYSTALVLYEGLTGSNPLRGQQLNALFSGKPHRQIASLAKVRPDLPPLLGEAVDQALAVGPEQRPDAAGLRKMLEKAVKLFPEPVPESGLWERTMVALNQEDRWGRMWFALRRVVAGACALAALTLILRGASFYPSAAVLPLIVFASFLTLLWPTGGGALTLLALAPPVFAFSRGWGFLYLVAVGASYALLSWRGLSWVALLPFLVVVVCRPAGGGAGFAGVLLAGVGLLLPFAAGMAAGFWGPFLGFWTGLSLALAAGLQGWQLLPYAFSPGGDAVLQATKYETSVAEVALSAARFLDARPELVVQILLFTLFAFPLRRLLKGDLERRLWVSASYLAAFGAGLLLSPPLLARVQGRPWLTILAFAPCAIIVLLSSSFIPTSFNDRVGVKHGVDAKG